MAKRSEGFGGRLASELRRMGWSNREFARRVDCHEQSIGNYKRGSVPEWDILVRMSDVLGRSICWLLRGEEPFALTGSNENRLPELDEPLRRWLEADASVRALLNEWAGARLDGFLVGNKIADLIEFQAKSAAAYLLHEEAPGEARAALANIGKVGLNHEG